jgi:hypothetical protein
MEWVPGSKWRFAAKRPGLQRTPFGPLELVWAINSRAMVEQFGYPQEEPIPDLYCRIRDGRHILIEVKTKDNIGKAVNVQLPSGVRLLRRFGKPVDLLAVSVTKLIPAEGWAGTMDGYLRRFGLADMPAEISGLNIILDVRRDPR